MMWNRRTVVDQSPLRALYVTSTPGMPRMRDWLCTLAHTLLGAGSALLVACPEGSLSEDVLGEQGADHLDYVYAAITGWGDVAGWFQWITLVRRYRPHSIHFASDLDVGTATRLALAARLAWPAALVVEARTHLPARVAGGLRARLLYRFCATQLLCDSSRQAAALIQSYRIAPARISLLRSAAPAEAGLVARRSLRGMLGVRASQRSVTAAHLLALRAHHLQALYQLLRQRNMLEPMLAGAPAAAPVAAPRAWRPSGIPRLAANAGAVETALPTNRALALTGPSASMSAMLRHPDAR